MNKEDKELLLKDLSARLPYGVIGLYSWKKHEPYNKELTGNLFDELTSSWNSTEDSEFLPYLHPMSIMIEEEFENLKEYSELKYEQLDLASYQSETYKCLDFYLSEVPSYVVILVFDWLNAYHFDYRGLIERGLAIAVTEDNNPYK